MLDPRGWRGEQALAKSPALHLAGGARPSVSCPGAGSRSAQASGGVRSNQETGIARATTAGSMSLLAAGGKVSAACDSRLVHEASRSTLIPGGALAAT